MKNITHFFKVTTLALILSFGLSFAYAWTAPTTTPPGGNTAAPLNVSGTSQLKNGALGIAGLIHGYSDAIFDGSANVAGILSSAKVQLADAVVSGTACSPTGLVSRDSSGILLSCQAGVWRAAGGSGSSSGGIVSPGQDVYAFVPPMTSIVCSGGSGCTGDSSCSSWSNGTPAAGGWGSIDNGNYYFTRNECDGSVSTSRTCVQIAVYSGTPWDPSSFVPTSRTCATTNVGKLVIASGSITYPYQIRKIHRGYYDHWYLTDATLGKYIFSSSDNYCGVSKIYDYSILMTGGEGNIYSSGCNEPATFVGCYDSSGTAVACP